MTDFAKRARKFLAALAALAGVLVANGLLDGDAAKWVTSVIAALGAFLVFYAPNAAEPAEVAGPAPGPPDGITG